MKPRDVRAFIKVLNDFFLDIFASRTENIISPGVEDRGRILSSRSPSSVNLVAQRNAANEMNNFKVLSVHFHQLVKIRSRDVSVRPTSMQKQLLARYFPKNIVLINQNHNELFTDRLRYTFLKASVYKQTMEVPSAFVRVLLKAFTRLLTALLLLWSHYFQCQL